MKKSALLILLMLLPKISLAYSVQPMIAEIGSIGNKTQLMMRVENTSANPLTIVMSPMQVNVDKNYDEVLSEAEDDLLVMPPTAIIPPGQTQSVLVRYIGDPSVTQSKSYRVIFDQADVNLDGSKKSQVQIKYRFLTLLNVKPQNTSAVIVHHRTYQEDDKWYIELENIGSSYARLSETTWMVGEENRLIPINGETVRNHVSRNLILPGTTANVEFIPFEDIDPSSMVIKIDTGD